MATKLTDAMKLAIHHYAAPGSNGEYYAPKTGTITALIERGLLTASRTGEHTLTDAGRDEAGALGANVVTKTATIAVDDVVIAETRHIELSADPAGQALTSETDRKDEATAAEGTTRPGRKADQFAAAAALLARQQTTAHERAATAGSYGRHAAPLADSARLDAYRRQLGGGRELTPKMLRRIDKKYYAHSAREAS